MKQLPWERPKIAMIISMFNGKVASVKAVNVSQIKIVGGTDETIPR